MHNDRDNFDDLFIEKLLKGLPPGTNLYISDDRKNLEVTGEMMRSLWCTMTACKRMTILLSEFPTISRVFCSPHAIGHTLDPTTFVKLGPVTIPCVAQADNSEYADFLRALQRLPELNDLILPAMEVSEKYEPDALIAVIKKVKHTLIIKLGMPQIQHEEAKRDKLYALMKIIFSNVHAEIKNFKFVVYDYRSSDYKFDRNNSTRFIELISQFIVEHKNLKRVGFESRYDFGMIGTISNQASFLEAVQRHPKLKFVNAQLVEKDNQGNHRIIRPKDNPVSSLDELVTEILTKKAAQDINNQLNVAVKSGNLEQVNVLIAQGASVNAKNENKEKPLHNAADKDGVTPLHNAADNGSAEIVNALIAHEAQATAADKNGVTPLHCAVQKGALDIVNFLIAKGANVNASRSDNGYTPLHVAAEFKIDISIVNALFAKGVDVSAVDNESETALHITARSGHLEMLKLLISKGLDVNTPSKSYSGCGRPLQIAAKTGHVDIVNVLCAHGADVSYGGHFNFTPLQLASYSGYVDVARALIMHGAEVEASATDSTTALSGAVKIGHLELVKLLIENGAKINSTVSPDRTPLLEYALRKGYEKVAEVLILNGAKVNIVDTDGDTALHCAVARGYFEIVTILIAKGAEVNAVNKKRQSPLSVATQNGNLELVKTLIAKGANVNVVDDVGKTPLYYATNSHNLELVKVLMAAGADASIADKCGESPISISQGFKEYGLIYKELANVLTAQKTEANAENDEDLASGPAHKI